MDHPFHRAVKSGDIESMQQSIASGTDVNLPDKRGWPSLSRAIERGHPEIARFLLEHGADVHARDRRGRQPLLWVAQFGPDDIAEMLVKRGADVIAADDQGKTPLLQAVRFGRTAIVKMLLKRGQWYKPHKSYFWGQAFFLAVRERRDMIVDVFLDAGQNINHVLLNMSQADFYESTALMEAAKTRNLLMVNILRRRGADVLKKSKRRSALTEALSHCGEYSTPTRTLLHDGAHLGLEEAVVTGNMRLAEQLITDAADVELRDPDGQTLLIWAAFHKRADAIRLLVRHGADSNARDRFGRNALMGAAAVGDTALAQFLTEHGADGEMGSRAWDESALACAARAGHIEFMRWFLKRFGLGKDMGASALTRAAWCNQLEAVRLLLDAGVDADAHTDYLFGRRALMWAAWNGNDAMTRLLLERGADADACVGGSYWATSLAASAGRQRVIRLLVEHGIAAEQKDKALLEALLCGHSETAEILLEGGADANSADHHQRTALMWAARSGKLMLVQSLLDRGASVAAVDKDGKRASDWAKGAGHTGIVVLLEEWKT